MNGKSTIITAHTTEQPSATDADQPKTEYAQDSCDISELFFGYEEATKGKTAPTRK